MQENNMSVFGTVIRNEEIADFMRLLNLAREIFKQELTVVEIMPGGLTNKNFRAVTEDGTQIAIRLAGQGTANYINRPGEKHNAGEIAGLGIAPEIYYYDPKTGSQIVEYIDAPTMHPVDFQTRDEVLVKAGAVMRRYHDSGLEFRPPSIPSPRLTSTRPSWTSTATGSATRAGSAWWRRWSASAPPTPSSRPAGCPATTTRWRRTSCSRASRCGSSTGSTAA